MTELGFISLLPAGLASNSILFATSYNDHSLNVLSLNGSSLSVLSRSYECGSEPTWLTVNYEKSALYCLNEGWAGNASITSYQIDEAGKNVKAIQVLPTLKSPIASTLFGPQDEDLAIAYYDTSSAAFFHTFGTSGNKNPFQLELTSAGSFNISRPGPIRDRQDASHPHHAVVDPAGRYVFIPDLGADLIRMYSIGTGSSPSGTRVTALQSLPAVPGSGPRHGAFAKVGGETYFYSLNELGNTITGYRVGYTSASPSTEPNMTQIFHFSTHGPGGTVPNGTKAAEIVVSPDQRFVIVSSRGENLLTIPNFDARNATALVSDPLITFAIDQKTGTLTLVQTAPAGGRNPRSFSLNRAGTLLVSALQDDNRVVIMERDVNTGLLGKTVANAIVGVGRNNGPSYAMFYEK